MIIAGILLAGGQSERFGRTDKLLAPFLGKPLVTHAAGALTACKFDLLIAVTASQQVAERLSGFQITAPPTQSHAQSDSLRAGLRLAERLGADRAVVVLGDMPNVTTVLIQEVTARCRAGTPSAAFDGRRSMPPACFPRESFSAIQGLAGDQGARTFFRGLSGDALVQAPDGELIDVDTPDDITKAAKARGG